MFNSTRVVGILYSDLPLDTQDKIRLVKIAGNLTASGDIILELSVANLAKDPNYLALSYTWGCATYEEEAESAGMSSTPECQIMCNGVKMRITKNLYAFLLMARDNPDLSARSMWIDAICINQGNADEQASQVSLMAAIFRSAEFIIVWLGSDGDGDAAKGFDLVKAIVRHPNSLDDISPENMGGDQMMEILGPCGDVMYWQSMAKLFRRRYFSRVWIIQEIILARKAMVFCGRHSISWDELVKASHFVAVTAWKTWIIAQSHHPFHHTIPTALYYSKHRDDRGLSRMLYYLALGRRFMALDDRDKIYALLGVGGSVAGKRRLYPDYNKSVVNIYTDAAIQILIDSDRLDLLAHAEGDEFHKMKDLPSWVPDWSCTQRVGIEGVDIPRFSAAGSVTPNIYIDEGRRTLTVKGVKLDDLVLVGESKRDLLAGKQIPGWLEILERAPPIYCTGESRFDVLWRTLIANTAGVPARYPASSKYGAAFSIWFQSIIQTCCDETMANYVLSLLSKPNGDAVMPDTDTSVSMRILDGGWYYANPTKHSVSKDDYGTTYYHAQFLRLFLTKNGYLGVGSESLTVHDSVWIIAGSSIPLVLREAEPGKFKLVGGVYVHGFMNGQAMERDPTLEDLTII
jgi:hypothetical protein